MYNDFEGVVTKVLLRASVSSSVVTYATFINVDNKDMRLKPGMTASVNIYIEEDSAALLIPSQALTFKPDTVLLKKYIIKRAEVKSVGVANVQKVKNTQVRDTTNNKNRENKDFTKSTVWVKNGDTLTERRILTSLNDNSSAKVVKGLSLGEEVVMSTVSVDSKTADKTGNTAAQSPFMPKMTRRQSGGGAPRN